MYQCTMYNKFCIHSVLEKNEMGVSRGQEQARQEDSSTHGTDIRW